MFQESLALIGDNFSGERARTITADLWGFDRWFDFAHFKRSASYSAEKFQEAGLSTVEALAFPADGQTRYGDWTVPLAWDVAGAELKIIEPETIPLASYTEEPCSLVMWSAPTPPGGVEAEVILLEDDAGGEVSIGQEGPPDPGLRGKILFSSRPAPELKRLAGRHGALGVISDHHSIYGSGQVARPPDKVSWVNAWSDDQHGWPFTKKDTPAFGFSLSARKGNVLRDLIRRGGQVKVTARVNSRLYSGSFGLVTGLIPGRERDEEVLVFAHLYEVGAQDNAGGCATVLEAARCLNELIAGGRLPQPQRSIRFMLSWEIYGLLAYATTRPEAMSRIVAALNLDSLGVPHDLCQARLELHRNPHAQASYTDVLLQRIMEHYLPKGEWSLAPFDTTDAVIADPAIGVPTPWLGEMISNLWHSSLDTPEKIEPQTLAREGSVAATYLYFIANATSQEIRWLAGEVYREAVKTLRQAGREAGPGDQEQAAALNNSWWKASRRLLYLRDRSRQALSSCARLDPSPELAELLAGFSKQLDEEVEQQLQALERLIASRAGAGGWSPPEPVPLSRKEQEAAGLAPRRKFKGGLSLGTLPPEAWPEAVRVTRGQNPRWSPTLCCALSGQMERETFWR